MFFRSKQVCITVIKTIIVIHTCLLLKNVPYPYGFISGLQLIKEAFYCILNNFVNCIVLSLCMPTSGKMSKHKSSLTALQPLRLIIKCELV